MYKVDNVPVPVGQYSAEELRTIRSMRDAFSMTKQRCYNPKNADYGYYGGRGITICDRWLESFDNLLADMGVRPSGMTLERKDNSLPYSPENCVWATRAAQGINTRAVKLITYQGETHSISEWERRKGFTPGTLKARLGPLKYSVEEAFAKPVVCGGKLATRVYKPKDTSSFTRFKSAEITAIRAAAAVGNPSLSSLARRFDTTPSTIKDVIQHTGAYRDA